MSKIINNLNQLEQQLNLNELQDSVDNNLQTEAKSIVGAINEIVGKQVISNAIGAPLTDSDTWSNMETKINSLLSSFKTNMMNNGVTVESGDKFKSLIDKIATMVEEGEGKSIQYVEGTIDPAELTYVKSFNYIEGTNVKQGDYKYLDLNYFNNSNMVIIHSIVEFLTGTSEFYMVYLCSNCVCVSKSIDYNTSNGVYFNNITTDIPVVPHNQYSTIHECSYYYVGVGEEDTTLRDSLASILENKGIDVSDEDDMAGLIGKVDQELDRINAETSIIKTGTATITNLYSDAETFTVNINPGFVPKEIICTIKSFQFNYSSGSYTIITAPTVVYSKYNNTASTYVTISPRTSNYGADVYISSISQSNFVVTITRFTGYSIPSMSIEWIAIS